MTKRQQPFRRSHLAQIYKPLPKGYFRLLQLHPNTDQFLISLHLFPLDNAGPSYEALSYAWGNQAATEPISCIGPSGVASNRKRTIRNLRPSLHQVLVTRHLLSCLEHLRSTTSRWLWIDAICINQHDNDEKAIQVPLMSEIFPRAKRVLIWLGEHNGHCEVAMQGIPGLLRQLREIDNLKENVDTCNFRYVFLACRL
jgi:hypothetical protein